MKFRLVPARLSLVLVLWAASAPAAQTLTPAEQVLATYPWADTANTLPPDWAGHKQLVDPTTGKGGKMLKVSNPGPGPLQVAVLTIPKPGITSDFYTLRGQVRYEDVAGDGYLEMWSIFSDGAKFWTRTLVDNPGDPVRKLSGTSDWRPILVPFDHPEAHAEGARPDLLTLNVVLPGHGTVYLTELQLVQVPGQGVPYVPKSDLAPAAAVPPPAPANEPKPVPSAPPPDPREVHLAAYPLEEAAKTVSPESLAHQQIVDLPNGKDKVLKISNPGGKPLQVNVLTVKRPPITADFYELRGLVKWADVEGNAYLEMWSVFPGGGHYFSRTLGDDPGGPMSKLTGTSAGNFRPFLLPFNATGAGAPPEQLEVNVVLPGHGTIYLCALNLFQSQPDPAAKQKISAWAGVKGRYGGFSGLGFVLTVAMVSLSFMAQRGSYRTFVIVGAWTLTTLTIVLLLAAILQAWKLGLPPMEWTLRLVVGVFVSGMFGACAWSFQRRYRHAEWRRMAALDA